MRATEALIGCWAFILLSDWLIFIFSIFISYIIYIKVGLLLYYLTLFYIRKKGVSRWSAHDTWSLKNAVRWSVNQDSTARPSPLIGRILCPVSQVQQACILQMTSGHPTTGHPDSRPEESQRIPANTECKSFCIYLVYLMSSV